MEIKTNVASFQRYKLLGWWRNAFNVDITSQLLHHFRSFPDLLHLAAIRLHFGDLKKAWDSNCVAWTSPFDSQWTNTPIWIVFERLSEALDSEIQRNITFPPGTITLISCFYPRNSKLFPVIWSLRHQGVDINKSSRVRKC